MSQISLCVLDLVGIFHSSCYFNQFTSHVLLWKDKDCSNPRGNCVTFDVLRLFQSFKLANVMQRRQCIIGGVAASDEVVFVISLQPMTIFCNLARRLRRVWLFKSSDSTTRGVVAAPLGLYARYVAYFSDRIDTTSEDYMKYDNFVKYISK